MINLNLLMKPYLREIYQIFVNGYKPATMLCHPMNKIELNDFLYDLSHDIPYLNHIKVHTSKIIPIDCVYLAHRNMNSERMELSFRLQPLVYVHHSTIYDTKEGKENYAHFYN